MTVYVDDAMIAWRPPHMRHRVWKMSHMFALTRDELLVFAVSIGLKPAWLQEPPNASWIHFDVNATVRKKALAAGAVAIKWRDLPRTLDELGLVPNPQRAAGVAAVLRDL